MPDLGLDPDNKDAPIKIAQITFAYNNSSIITDLTKRGTLIKTEKWQKVAELNQTILTKIQDKKILDLLQTPCSVFATFESEEGVNRALKWDQEPQYKFCGQELEL